MLVLLGIQNDSDKLETDTIRCCEMVYIYTNYSFAKYDADVFHIERFSGNMEMKVYR